MIARLLGKKRPAPVDPVAVAAARLVAEAETARDAGDINAAVACYQAALELSPLSRDLREAFADALMEAAERKAKGRRGPKPGASQRILDECEPDEPPAPRRPLRKPLQALVARRKATAPAPSPAPAPRRAAAPEPPRRRPAPVAPPPVILEEEEPLLDDEFDFEQDEIAAEAPPPRRGFVGFAQLDEERASRRASRQSPPYPSARRRFSPRALVLAGFYAGILFVAVGLAHSMIASWLAPAALPTIPSTAPALPDVVADAVARAEARLAAGDPKEALDILEATAKAHPAHADAIAFARATAWRSMGSRMLDARDYGKAAEAYRFAAELRPDDAANWIDLARVFREHGRSIQAADGGLARRLLDKSRQANEQALQIRPNDPSALLGLAQTYAFLSRRTEAIAHYDKVIASAPESPEARLAQEHLRQLRGS